MNNHIDGCSLHAVCNTCPFPECKAKQADIMRTRAKDDKQARYKKVIELAGKGIPTKEICKKVGYRDIGTIYKILSESKRARA